MISVHCTEIHPIEYGYQIESPYNSAGRPKQDRKPTADLIFFFYNAEHIFPEQFCKQYPKSITDPGHYPVEHFISDISVDHHHPDENRYDACIYGKHSEHYP